MTPEGDGPPETPDSPDDQPHENVPLSLDALLDILANERRRYLLEYLWEQPDNTASFDAVVEHTITEIGRNRGSRPNHHEVQIDLQHRHLPKLAEAGLIEYDIRSRTIRYHENERLETLYERVRDLAID